jgi:cholesterol oxidase
MVGCRHGAKNTLVKNYLWFAERLGVEVIPERQATEIRPLGGHGSEGYEVITEHPGAWFRKRRRTFSARGVVVAAGPLGSNQLLADCKHSGALGGLSDRLGEVVRTNTESIQAVTAPDDSRDFTRSVAITSSIYPDPDTHIEVVTYGGKGDAISRLFTTMTGAGTRVTRPLKWIGAMLRHPLQTAKLFWWPFGWSRRTVILLVMQTIDTAMSFKPRKRLLGRGVRLQTEQDPERPNPTFIPAAEAAARWFAERTGGVPQSGLTESAMNIPTTAHILGGAVIGATPAEGVVDARHRVFGYENLLITDGSAMPANPGVNPSLTITAMAERAMSFVPPKGEGAVRTEELPEAARAAPLQPPVAA